jgi:tetratricopeptide (TPR) repeat protein
MSNPLTPILTFLLAPLGQILNSLGYICYKARNYELAIALISQAIFIDSYQANFYKTAGKVYFATRNFEDAVDAN